MSWASCAHPFLPPGRPCLATLAREVGRRGGLTCVVQTLFVDLGKSAGIRPSASLHGCGSLPAALEQCVQLAELSLETQTLPPMAQVASGLVISAHYCLAPM